MTRHQDFTNIIMKHKQEDHYLSLGVQQDRGGKKRGGVRKRKAPPKKHKTKVRRLNKDIFT